MKQKETPKATRNDEIRLRYVEQEIFDKLEPIKNHYKEKTVPGAVLALISSWKMDREVMQQLIKRNNQLHDHIQRYVDREAEMKSAVEEFIKYTGQYNSMTIARTKAVLKKFTGKKTSRVVVTKRKSKKPLSKKVIQASIFKGGKK